MCNKTIKISSILFYIRFACKVNIPKYRDFNKAKYNEDIECKKN